MSQTAVAQWRSRADAALREPRPDLERLIGLAREGHVRRRAAIDRAIDPATGLAGDADGIVLLAALEERSARVARRLVPFQPPHEEFARRLADQIAAFRKALKRVLVDPTLVPARRAILIGLYQLEAAWLGMLVGALDGEAPVPRPERLAARLDSLQGSLREAAPGPTAAGSNLSQRVGTLEWRVLASRVARELERVAKAPADRAPAELWADRLILSEIKGLIECAVARASRGPPPDCPVETWRSQLDQRRAALAASAEERLVQMEPKERGRQWRSLVLAAHAESGAVAVRAQDLDVAAAIQVLDLAREDFSQLARTGSRTSARRAADSERLPRFVRQPKELARRWADEITDRRLRAALERLFGRAGARALESTVLVLILLWALVVGLEWGLDAARGLSERQREIFAWIDLAISSVLLSEFLLRLVLVNRKGRYFRRRFLVDFLASLPVGFFTYEFTHWDTVVDQVPQLLRLGRLFYLPRLGSYLRLAQPLVRGARLIAFVVRGGDQLVHRLSGVLNRNLIFFEPGVNSEDARHYHHELAKMVMLVDHARRDARHGLPAATQAEIAEFELADLEVLARCLPLGDEDDGDAEAAACPARPLGNPTRDARVEVVIEHLIEMTPERALTALGGRSCEVIARYSRLLDIPLVRRLPLARELARQRERGSAEVAALVANFIGHFLQALLNVGYFLADLHATVTPPIFLDRVGATLVVATARPAKRLILFGSAVLLLSLLVWPLPILGPVVSWIDQRLVRPILIVGLLCLLPLSLGLWLRRIANQAAEYCERVVEAQFAAQTKRIKLEHEPTDLAFLAERVVEPERRLRACDDPKPLPASSDATPASERLLVVNDEEGLFQRTVRLLYQDYLDGSLLHQSDTKTTTQLLGNLALSNFRLSNRTDLTAGERRLKALDLSRSGGTILGGPFLWFQFVTRGITQQTARLLIDYNRNALPLARLACAPRWERERFRAWLASRLELAPDRVALPAPVGRFGDACADLASVGAPRREPGGPDFFQTVDFMAIDFLTADPERDQLIGVKYGAQVLELLRRDRRLNVRRAFRSFPLDEIPPVLRTFNPLGLYETYLADGKFFLLPPRLAFWILRAAARALGRMRGLIREILSQGVVESGPRSGGDSYAVARRKVHRMRKPVFLESLWLRARFDVEYVGLALPLIPLPAPRESLLERDLEFIGASRRDRIRADRLRRDHRDRLVWITPWLERLGWSFEALARMVAADYPFLAGRTAEVERAIVTAAVLDHDEIFTLGCAAAGLELLVRHGLDPANDRAALPEGLPPAARTRARRRARRWRSRRRARAALAGQFAPAADAKDRKRVERYLARHRAFANSWIDVLAELGDRDPWGELAARWHRVIARTTLWSDQVIALRTIQTLTILDVYRYCELVWQLGGYEEIEQQKFGHELPWQDRDEHESGSAPW